MCDYSLEHYHSRPARQGETYVSHRFQSSTVGFISPEEPNVAVCMACDTVLQLDDISPELQQMLKLRPSETVTFTRIEHGLHKDAVRLANGATMSLQQLGPGVKARVVDALTDPVATRELELAE